MKQRKLAIAAALLTLSVWAEGEVWCLVTDSGERIAMSSVVCLAAADDDSTFTVVAPTGIIPRASTA